MHIKPGLHGGRNRALGTPANYSSNLNHRGFRFDINLSQPKRKICRLQVVDRETASQATILPVYIHTKFYEFSDIK